MTWQIIPQMEGNTIGEKWDVPQRMKNIWDKWDIRGVILFSLSLQIILILFSPLRKRTERSFLVWSLWSAYLLADWAASFCVGLISNSQKDDEPISQPTFLRAFWAPFLLLHLGGPDTITAFALEDNELWQRHLLGLLFQVVACAYVFFLTLPHNTLWIPTVLVFLAGIIKYAERTRALYLASMNTFRQSMIPAEDPGPNYAKLMEEYFSKQQSGLPSRIVTIGEQYTEPNIPEQVTLTDLEVVERAYDLFDKFKGLIADKIFSVSDRDESRVFFQALSDTNALRVIEVELNFIYEIFYTKVSVLRTMLGYFLRFVSFSSLVAATALFILDDKRGFKKFDIRVTYTLLCGALGLDFVALIMLIFSDRTCVSTKKSEQKSFIGTVLKFIDVPKQYLIKIVMVHFLRIKRPKWSKCKKKPYTRYDRLSTRFVFRRWCGSMSGYNFIIYCLDQCTKDTPRISVQGIGVISDVIKLVWFKAKQFWKYAFNKVVDNFGAKDLIVTWKYKEKNPFLKELWQFIFDDLKGKSKKVGNVDSAKKVCSSRGENAIGDLDTEHRDKLMPYVDSNEVTFDEGLMLWHIATHLCYEEDDDKISEKERKEGDDKISEKERKESDDKMSETEKKRSDDKISEKERKEGDDKISEKEKKYDKTHGERHFSKLLSDYMLYLLIMQPTMMSSMAGIGQIRFQDTCAEAIKFFNKRDLEPIEEEHAHKRSQRRCQDTYAKAVKFFCKRDLETRKERRERIRKKNACQKLMMVRTDVKPIDVKGDRSKSVLFDACILAKKLNELPENLKWPTIAKIWMEILSYAAANCRPTEHVQQVSKGGELISFVWLLMVHLGLGTQFQIKEGHARAKLIVGM